MIKEGENATLPANFVLRNVLLRDLNTRFSSGIDGIVVGENLRESSYNRPIGFSIHTILAVALDPRTKNGIGVEPRDIEDMYKKLKEWAVRAVENNQILNVNNSPTAHPGAIIRRDGYHSILAMMDVDDDNANIPRPIIAKINNTQQLVDAEISQYRAEKKLNRIVAGVAQPNDEPSSSSLYGKEDFMYSGNISSS